MASAISIKTPYLFIQQIYILIHSCHRKCHFHFTFASIDKLFFKKNLSIMSQADVDAFVASAEHGALTSKGVTAAVARGVLINQRHSRTGRTALLESVIKKRREVVEALLAAGADANVTNNNGATSVLLSAWISSADIVQLLLTSKGSINEPDIYGQTPLIALVRYNYGDAAARLKVLLACPQLDLDASYDGKTAEEWATDAGRSELAVVIAEERARRERWSVLRCAWIAATIVLTAERTATL